MGKDEKTYSRDDFDRILRQATELEGRPEVPVESAGEFSLDDMKAIAEEAGIDPALIERAVCLSGSERGGAWLDRTDGGLIRRRISALFPVALTQERTAHLLSVIRSSAQEQGAGDATASDLTWEADRGRLLVTAHGEGEGSRVQVSIDRSRATVFSGLLGILSGWMVAGSLEPTTFAVVAGSAAVGLGVATAVATARISGARKRAAALMDSISEAMSEIRQLPKAPDHRDGSGSVESDSDPGAS